MRARISIATILLTQFLFVGGAIAGKGGLHLGIKLSAKKYGDAWNSGSLTALHGVATPDFAAQFDRVPPEAFAEIPRNQGKGKVISSSKGKGSGTLTVATDQGVVTLALVGKGFHWQVADIYKAGDDGHQISVKNYMDVSLTAGEFMKNLKEKGGDSFHYAISSDFQAAFAELSESDINHVREFLPPVKFNLKPYIELRDNWAKIHIRLPNGGPNDQVVFSMVRQGNWRVDDYTINSATTNIASFRRSLPAIASLSALGKFVNDPVALDPASFTAPGDLRDALTQIRFQKPFPLPQGEKMLGLEIAGDGTKAVIRYPNRQVKITILKTTHGMALANMDIKMGEQWQNAAPLIAMQGSLNSSPFATMMNAVTNGALGQTKSDASVSTTFASASKVEKQAPTVAKSTTSTSYKPVVKSTEVVAAAPVASQTVSPPLTMNDPKTVQASHTQPSVPSQPSMGAYDNTRQYNQGQRRGLNIFRRRR